MSLIQIKGIHVYFITVETQFDASHRLVYGGGQREQRHSHRWQVTAEVASRHLNADGLVMDFLELQKIVDASVAPLAGQPLEELDVFAAGNASAEAVAQVLFEAVAPQIPPPAKLMSMAVVEAPGCRACYRPDR